MNMDNATYVCTECGSILDNDMQKLRILPDGAIEAFCAHCGKHLETCYPEGLYEIFQHDHS